MQQRKSGKGTIWKWLFLLLLSMNLALGILLLDRVYTKREELPNPVISQVDDWSVGRFVTNREQLNHLFDDYLSTYQSDSIRYRLFLTPTELVFEGTYLFLGSEIPLAIYFQPIRMEDGSVQLYVDDISAGTLRLPKTEVLSYIQKNYKLPSFVRIQPQEESVFLYLQEIENKQGIYAKMNTIDLVHNQIIVDVYKKIQK